MNNAILAAALAAGAVATVAVAQAVPSPERPAPSPRHGLARADADHDGIVSRSEAITLADRRFDRLDADRDGRITAAERAAVRAAKQARRAMRNGDVAAPTPPALTNERNDLVAMTRESFRARLVRRFDRADGNRDGRLDQAELAAVSRRRPGSRDQGTPLSGAPAE